MAETGYVSESTDRLAGSDIFRILWAGKFALIAITSVITAAVAAAAFLIPPKYEATVLMMAVPDTESEDRIGGSAVSQLGGLASLAGLSGSGGTLKAEAMATLESEALTVRYIRDNNLLPVLYADRWDAARGQWKPGDPRTIPTLWKANRYFRGIRSVTDNVRTGLISLTITWRDPRQAAAWANDIVAMTNDYLRDRAIAEAERNISFLEEQERKVNIVPLQQAISALTETQLRKMMLARGRQQYALKVLDPATVPERKAYPVPSIWIPAGFFGGFFLAALFVLLRASGQTPRAHAR
jgi:uncharacterized protein involved in exopolysaccharide biosynthesis